MQVPEAWLELCNLGALSLSSMLEYMMCRVFFLLLLEAFTSHFGLCQIRQHRMHTRASKDSFVDRPSSFSGNILRL